MTCPCGEPLDHGHRCPRCIGRLRGNLRSIVEDMALMPAESLGRGIDSNPTDLTGPVAHPILHRWRQVNADRAGLYAEEPDDDDPYTALAVRERMIREELGHDSAVLCSETLAGAVAYLGSVLTDLARDETLTLLLDDLIDTARRLRARLDADLRNQHGPERGAPCPECDAPRPRLIRRWSHWCEDPDCYRVHDATGALDTWACPADEAHWWTEEDYRLRVADAYLANADALTAGEMAQQYGVRPGTLRQWAARDQVRKRGKDASGRQTYDVGDVCRLLRAEPTVAVL